MTDAGKGSPKERLLDAVRREPSATRAEVKRDTTLRLAGAALATAVVFGLFGGAHATLRPAPSVFAVTAAWSAISVATTFLVLRRGRAMVGTRPSLLLATVVVVPVLLAAAWFAFPWPDAPASAPRGLAIDATCFGLTIALAGFPLAAFFAVRRDGDPLHPGWTGAALGAAAGAWGSTFIELHCDLALPRHVLVGHLGPVLLLAALGASAGQLLLALRADRG
jgi:hypothetical protein